jgi:hypothetical protein
VDVRYALVHAQTPNSGTTGGFRLKTNGTSGYGYLQIINTAETVEYGFLRFDQNATEEMYWSGKITAADNITAFSDETLKTDIKQIPDAIEKVLGIRGVTYRKIDAKEPDKYYTGVIAQEVQRVLPEAVEIDSDGVMSVAYGNMVGVLIEAIKEQQLTIKQLEARINKLESE